MVVEIAFCKAKGFNQEFYFLLDFSVHSGKNGHLYHLQHFIAKTAICFHYGQNGPYFLQHAFNASTFDSLLI